MRAKPKRLKPGEMEFTDIGGGASLIKCGELCAVSDLARWIKPYYVHKERRRYPSRRDPK